MTTTEAEGPADVPECQGDECKITVPKERPRGARISMKFAPDMAKLSLEGRKLLTSRTEMKGRPGDTFEIDGVDFVLIEVALEDVTRVAYHFYRLEGFTTPEEFIAKWNECYPDRPFDRAEAVWCHWYTRAHGEAINSPAPIEA